MRRDQTHPHRKPHQSGSHSPPGRKPWPLPARPIEYFVTRKGEVERNVVVVVRGRVYQLLVTAKDRKGTEDKVADTFLTSLILHAPKPKEPGKKGETPAEKKPAP